MKNKISLVEIIILALILNFFSWKANSENSVYRLNAEKIKYDNNNNIITAEGEAYATDQFGNEIFSKKIIYNKDKMQIFTEGKSIYKDKKKNIIYADIFNYEIKLKKLSARNNVKFIEKNNNEFYFSEFQFFEISEIGYGKNLIGILKDKSTIESKFAEIDNIKGKIILKNSDKNYFRKIYSLFSQNPNIYTTCINLKNDKNIRESCPDWSLSTTETVHDQKSKTISHRNAVLNIRNIPVFYTPYFSHPEPSVKRKTGFLTPTTKNFSNLGRTFKVPYFFEIDNSSDLTFTPIFYNDDNDIYLVNYRKQNLNDKLEIDTSYSKGYKNLNKLSDDGNLINRTDGSRNHLFMNFEGFYKNIIFRDNFFNINLQRISQKNYIKINQINNDLFTQDITNLTNKIVLNSYEKNKKLEISSYIYENLADDNSNTKYQHKFPLVNYINYFNLQDYSVNQKNLFEANNYNGDTKQIIQINRFDISSKDKIIKNLGMKNTFFTTFSNINLYNENVENFKENFNQDFKSILALKSTLPMVRAKKNKIETIQPIIFAKYSPGNMKDQSDKNHILNYNDIYSMDRNYDEKNIETGLSTGYGIEYETSTLANKNSLIYKTKASFGQVLNIEDNKKMPANSSLNRKTSDFVGNFNFLLNQALKKNEKNLNDGIQINYEFNVSNELKKIHKNKINLSYENNKNKLSSEFYELNEIGNDHYVEFNYLRKLDNNLNFSIGARKNLELDQSETNFVEVNYDSDCLKFGLKLTKNFYEDADLKKDNNLLLFLTLKPFGQPFAPNLNNLINN